MDTGMKGKRVLVTAGAQGIGLAITEAFVAAGAEVHICDISEAFLADAGSRFVLRQPLAQQRQQVRCKLDKRVVFHRI